MCRISLASRVPPFGVAANRTIVNQGMLEPLQVQRALDYKVPRPVVSIYDVYRPV